MMMQRKRNEKETVRGRNGLTKYPGICEAAKELGVCRTHLWYVLRGDRRSPRIERSEYYRRMKGGAK